MAQRGPGNRPRRQRVGTRSRRRSLPGRGGTSPREARRRAGVAGAPRSPGVLLSDRLQDEPHARASRRPGGAYRHRRLRRRLFVARPAERPCRRGSAKIDRSFVSGMESDQSDAAIVSSTIKLSHRLGLEVIAEGVETPAHLARLRAAGCDIGQGHLLGRPLPGDPDPVSRPCGTQRLGVGRGVGRGSPSSHRLTAASGTLRGCRRETRSIVRPVACRFSSASESGPSPNPRGRVTGVAPRIDGRRLDSVEAVGKHLLLRFQGSVVVRSHLRMNGRWRVRRRTAAAWRGSPWLVLRSREWEATQWRQAGARPG